MKQPELILRKTAMKSSNQLHYNLHVTEQLVFSWQAPPKKFWENLRCRDELVKKDGDKVGMGDVIMDRARHTWLNL